MNFKRILLITLLSVTGRAALPLCAQTLITVQMEQYPPLQVMAETVTVDLPPEGITLGSDLVVTGGDGSYRYAWTNASGQALGQSSTLAITAPGTYFLAVTDGHDCSVSTQFTVAPSTAVKAPATAQLRQIRLFDTKGQLVKTITPTGAHAAAHDLGLPAGVYVECSIYSDGRSDVRKITINRP